MPNLKSVGVDGNKNKYFRTAMNQKEVVDIIDDRISQRFESFAQTMNALHKDSHDKILIAVEAQIKTTVNGKIDAIKKQLDSQDVVLKSLDERIKPFEDGVSWFTRAKNGAGWVAGFSASIALIWGSMVWIINQLNK